MRIQLITFAGCPNASATRSALERVLAAAGITDPIEEIDTSAPETAEPLRGWGSPTVLLDGKDVGEEAAPTAPSCRLYKDGEGTVHGAPPESLLSAAVRRAILGRC
jgi:hypothetical protein